MSCIYPACGKPDSSETEKWNVGKLCLDHYREVRGNYYQEVKGKASIPLPLAHDFVKVHVLLQFNTQQCLSSIGALQREMSAASRGSKDPRFEASNPNYLKLSRALEYYEGLCWFPANRTMFTGVLGENQFYQYVQYGLNKDPGAGPIHGDQSHRLQWHVIMRCMTNDFKTAIHRDAGWRHSPLGLFHEYTLGAGQGIGAWAKSMDRRENLGWGNPDAVAVDILQRTDKNPLIATALNRRIAKMGGVNMKNVKPGGKPHEAEKLGQIHFDLANRGVFPSPDKVMEKYVRMKTRERTHLEKFFRVGSEGNYQQRDEHVLIKKDAPDQLVPIDVNRVGASEGGLNEREYRYSKKTGAEPIVPVGTGRW